MIFIDRCIVCYCCIIYRYIYRSLSTAAALAFHRLAFTQYCHHKKVYGV